MITIISGAPGAGKSSINSYFLKKVYFEEGRTLLKNCRDKICELNKTRKTPLTLPEMPPIFSDYKVKFRVGYDKFFEPYFINGYYFGLANERMDTQFIPPYSKIFLGEAQRYYNSRKSANFPDFVSRAYEMHRHYHLDIYMDVQRVWLIDANIRSLCRRFIEVQNSKNILNDVGDIIKTIWYCREFNTWAEYEDYLNTGAQTYSSTTYTHDGNIFDCFDSFSYFDSFIPDERHDFSFLKFVNRTETEKLPEDKKIYYKSGEPDGFRRKVDKNEGKDRSTA